MQNLETRVGDPELWKYVDPTGCFQFQAKGQEIENQSQFRTFVTRLKELTGQVSVELSLLQPAAYERAMSYVDRELGEIQKSRRSNSGDPSDRCLITWEAWETGLKQQFPMETDPAKVTSPSAQSSPTTGPMKNHASDSPAPSSVLDSTDVEHITGYLDSAGRILVLRGPLQVRQTQSPGSPRGSQLGTGSSALPAQELDSLRHVVIDRTWVLGKVYKLLNHSGGPDTIAARLRTGSGWISEAQLLEDDLFSGMNHRDSGARPMLDFMETCGILVRVHDRFFVTERHLLPQWTEVEKQHQQAVQQLGTPEAPRQGWELDFPNPQLCEFDIRAIFGALARRFGVTAKFFQDGMQADGVEFSQGRDRRELREGLAFGLNAGDTATDHAGQNPTRWIVRVKWVAEDEHSSLGRLRVGICTAGPHGRKVVEELARAISQIPGVMSDEDAECRIAPCEYPDVFTELQPPKAPEPVISGSSNSQGKQPPAPRVFISYSWDSSQHNQRVLDLANFLRGNWIDAQLDQYQASVGGDWTSWMEEQVAGADFIVMIVSPRYVERARNPSSSGVRHEWRTIQRRIGAKGSSNQGILVAVDSSNTTWERQLLSVFNADRFPLEKLESSLKELIRDRIKSPLQQPPLSNDHANTPGQKPK